MCGRWAAACDAAPQAQGSRGRGRAYRSDCRARQAIWPLRHNGPEFVARNVRAWLGRIGVKTLFIEPGSPWENGYCESFNSKLRDELLAGELFSTLYEAKVLIECWRRHYNTIRPHSSLGYRPPAPETVLLSASPLAYPSPRPAEPLATNGRVLT